MSRWSIDPSGVVEVLTQVNPYAEALGDAVNGLTGPLSAAVTATNSAAIAEAVQSYFELVETPRIQGISTRISAATGGVVSATKAYVAGDLTMAENAQAASVQAVYPPDLPSGGM